MAINCNVGPPLHIPHISKPYDDQNLMENFQAIQRWADRLGIQCEGCDCGGTGEWVITAGEWVGPTGNTTDPPFNFDIGSELLSAQIVGEASDSPGLIFTIYKNGTPIHEELISSDGPFDITFDVNENYEIGDEITYSINASLATLSFTGLDISGVIPGMDGDPIGIGNDYKIGLFTQTLGLVPLADHELTFDGFDVPISPPEDSYPYLTSTSWSSSSGVEGSIFVGTSSGGSMDATLNSATFYFDDPGAPSVVLISIDSGGGFVFQSSHSIAPGQTSLSIPLLDDTTSGSYVVPNWSIRAEVGFDPDMTFTLTSATSQMTQPHSDEVLLWPGGG